MEGRTPATAALSHEERETEQDRLDDKERVFLHRDVAHGRTDAIESVAPDLHDMIHDRITMMISKPNRHLTQAPAPHL